MRGWIKFVEKEQEINDVWSVKETFWYFINSLSAKFEKRWPTIKNNNHDRIERGGWYLLRGAKLDLPPPPHNCCVAQMPLGPFP